MLLLSYIFQNSWFYELSYAESGFLHLLYCMYNLLSVLSSDVTGQHSNVVILVSVTGPTDNPNLLLNAQI